MENNQQQIKKTQRQCLVTKNVLDKSEMLRFVADYNNNIVFDVNHKLPGKGIWITADIAVLEKAISKNMFLQKHKNVKVEELSLEVIANQLKLYILGLISLANKAGLVVLGQDRIGQHLDRDEVKAVIIAKDSSQNSKNKLQFHIKDNTPIVDVFTTADMDNIFPKDKVAFVGLRSGKIVENILNQSLIYKNIYAG